jgi:hypothetical protein
MEELMKCIFKCWKNGEFKTFRTIHATVFYDTDRDWIVTKVGKSVKSSYKVSNVTDVQRAFWGTYLRHDMVTVWVTDDDGNHFQFDYDGKDAPRAYLRMKALAETSSPHLRALPKVLALLGSGMSVPLKEVLERLPEREARKGVDAAREVVQHLIETNAVAGRIDGDLFVPEGVAGGGSHEAAGPGPE